MNWSGLKPGVDWVQEAFCLSGGRVSGDAQGFTAPSCSLLLSLPYGQL